MKTYEVKFEKLEIVATPRKLDVEWCDELDQEIQFVRGVRPHRIPRKLKKAIKKSLTKELPQ